MYWKVCLHWIYTAKVWTDFQDFWTNFTHFRKNQGAGGKFKVLTLWWENGMANKILFDPKSTVRKSVTAALTFNSLQKLCRAGPRWRARGRTTLGVHPLSWLLSNNRLEKVPFVSVPHTSSNWLLLSNQDKGCTPSVAHFLALPLGPALHNVWNLSVLKHGEKFYTI